MVPAKLSRKQTTGFAMETADIPTIQEISRIKITKEKYTDHFLRYQGCCSL